MKNKIVVICCSVLLFVPVVGFTSDKQKPDPKILANERAHEKATFDYHQDIYNNKANTEIRAENLVHKEKKTQNQEKKKAEEIQNKTKGQVLVKF